MGANAISRLRTQRDVARMFVQVNGSPFDSIGQRDDGQTPSGAASSGRGGRARCVPDRPVSAGNLRSLPDNPIYRLTCGRAG